MTAHFEPTAGVIRVYRHGNQWGDPFDLALAVSGDEGVATLKALSHATPRPDDFAAIAQALRAAGFHTMRWTRHRPDGTVQEKRFSTARRDG
jgi:hypothetical protein